MSKSHPGAASTSPPGPPGPPGGWGLGVEAADFGTLFEFLPIGAYRSLPNGRQLRANPALVALNGYRSEAEMLAAVNDIAQEWYVDRWRRDEFRRLLEQHGHVRGFVSEVYRHHTRERIWIAENAHVVRDAAGEVLFYEGTVEEVTDRVRSEAALRRSEEHLRQIANHVPGLVYRVHFASQGPVRYSFVSEGCRSLLGVEPAALMAEPTLLRRFCHPADVELVDRAVAAAIDGRAPLALECRIVLPDGRLKWIYMSSSAAAAEGDEQIRVGVIVDITAQRESESALHESEKRWKLALDSAGDGVWDWDIEQGREALSQRCKEMYGLADDGEPETIETLDSRTHPDDLAQMQRDRQAHLEGRTPAYVNEHRIRCGDGSWKWILSRGMVIRRDAAGRPLRMIGTHTDITERRQAEALRMDRDRAESAQRAMTQFLSRVSHELRTPLNAILGFSQLMETEPDTPPRQRGWAREVLASGRHLLGLVDDILDLSGVQSGQLAFDIVDVPLAAVVDECVTMVAAMAQAMAVQLDVDAVLASPFVVRADRKRLKQVLSNLLSNAIKYNRPTGRVQLAATQAAGLIELAVADTGRGLSAEQLARLFQPFERAGAQRTEVPGSGLGLALSRQLVHAMHGEITVHSVAGAGSTFTLQLPAGGGAGAPG